MDTFLGSLFSCAWDAANQHHWHVFAVSPPHWVCAHSRSVCFPCLHCVGSARNCLRPALGCMHLPGLSRSGSGTGVLLRGADSVGPACVPFPDPSSSDDQVFGERGCCHLLSLPPTPPPVGAARVSGCTTGAPSQADVDRLEPQEVLVSNEACLQFGR